VTAVEPEILPLTEESLLSLQLIQELREQTRQLVDQLDGPVRRVALAVGACTVEVEWSEPGTPGLVGPPFAMQPAPVFAPLIAEAPAAGQPAPVASAEPSHRVTAPLVGMFYRAPQPGAAPFVEVGDVVEPGQTLAIVEAMKLMNPIVADRRGQVVAIHAADGEVVEYDQPLLDLGPVPAGTD